MEKLTLEDLRKLSNFQFQKWVRNRIGDHVGNIQYDFTIKNTDAVRMPTYCLAYKCFSSKNSVEIAVIIAFGFAKTVTKEALGLPFNHPNRQIILLTVAEMLEDDFNLLDKIESSKNKYGNALSYFKFNNDK